MEENKKPYILIVEDDQAYGKVFERKLSREGFETKWVSDGKKGLEAVEEKMPDLMILDLMMPNIDGMGVLAELKNRGLMDKIKVIVATNLSQEVDVAKAKDAGADDYFVKSDLSIAEMVKKVNTVLGK